MTVSTRWLTAIATRWTTACIGVLLFVLVGAQAFAVPLGAGPDEPAHLIRSAGIVRGQVFGDALGSGTDSASRVFELPAWVGTPDPGCFVLRPAVPVSCAPIPDTDERTRQLTSSAASNPPWSHILPGVATLGPGGARTAWLSRLLHSLVPVVTVTLVIRRLVRAGRRLAGAAVLLALTPTAIFTFAVVNPSGWAIAGALAIWVAGIDLARGDRSASALFVLGWCVGVLPRSDGLLWSALCLAVVLFVARCPVTRFVSSLSVVQRAVLGVASAANLVWAAVVPPMLLRTNNLEDAGVTTLVGLIVSRTGDHFKNAVGVVGWLDTPLPTTALFLWWATIGVLAGVSLLTGNRRALAGALVAVVGFAVVGWAMEFAQVRSVGLFWQGRYALPLLMGLPLLLATSPVERSETHVGGVEIPRSLPVVIAVAAVVVWNAAFVQSMRRWGVGADGSVLPWKWATWETPVPMLVLVLVYLVASVLLAALVVGPTAIRERELSR